VNDLARLRALLAEAVVTLSICLNCRHPREEHDLRIEGGGMWCKHVYSISRDQCPCPGWGGNGPLLERLQDPALLDELESLRAVAEAAEAHGVCTCYPRGDRHAPECNDDPDLRAALAKWIAALEPKP
jgi:hypothetical protein